MLLVSKYVRLRACRRIRSPFIGVLRILAPQPIWNIEAWQPSVHSQRALRTLFELHAGRKGGQAPSNLSIDEGISPLSVKNDLPRSTSQELIEALGTIGEEYQTPKKHAHMTDLSYTDAATAELDWRLARREAAANFEAGRHEAWGLHPKDALIQYIRHIVPVQQYQTRLGKSVLGPQMDKALLKVFDHRITKYLDRKSWDITHLMDWTWILTADTAERAASRLAYLGHLGIQHVGQHKDIPQFVHLFLLRRRSINAPALRTLLVYTWEYMEWLSLNKAQADKDGRSSEGFPPVGRPRPTGMEEFKFMIVIIRLLRAARKVLPAACESIVALLCRYLDGSDFQKQPRVDEDFPEDRMAALAFMYNAILKLVADPASLHPFRSATHQQRAQFMILRRMNQFDPPLLVDRRGYRAVTRMQLMHHKTSRERDWARLKAQSWPPWKIDKLGTDASKGPDYGISRAKEVLNRAREAGYASDDWDDAASILSGWDTDNSPTIQSRAIVEDPVKDPDERAKNAIWKWAARIKATRTLDEAWAAFLSFEDSGTKRRAVVYQAMFEKLFYDAKRKKLKHANETNLPKNGDDQRAWPGDGPEVYPTPESPRDAIYVRTAAPSIDGFFQKMKGDGVRPKATGQFLVLLIRHAESLEKGIQYLKASDLSSEHIAVLLERRDDIAEDPESQRLLAEVPPRLFASFIELLSRSTAMAFAGPDKASDAITRAAANDIEAIKHEICPIELTPFNQAIRLVHARKPRERPPWYSLLSALSRSGLITPFASYTSFRSYSAVANWKTSCWLLECMEELDIALDLDALKILCTGLEKAIFEAEEVVTQKMGIENVRHIPRSDLDLVLDKGLPLMMRTFKDIVRSDSMQQDIPEHILDKHDHVNPKLESLLGTDDASLPEMDKIEDDFEDEDLRLTKAPGSYLPPACLLPKLLEIPNTAQLHSFIRVIGLRRDYQGLLDIIEWMALYADEIRTVTENQQNSSRMMRRCMTATRVFLERSWLHQENLNSQRGGGPDIDAAPTEIWQVVHDTVMETKYWGGWPTDDEVSLYCEKGRFI